MYPGVSPVLTTGMLSSRGRPAFSRPLWVVSWKITVPTVSSLPLQTRSPELRTRGEPARVQLTCAEHRRFAFQTIGKIGSDRRGREREHDDREQPHEQPGVAPDPWPQPALSGVVFAFARDGPLVPSIHESSLPERAGGMGVQLHIL